MASIPAFQIILEFLCRINAFYCGHYMNQKGVCPELV